MSKRNNYTNYRNAAKPVDEAVPAEVKEEVLEVVEEETVETEVKEVLEAVEETVETEIGVVLGCDRLNVRKEANIKSEVATVVPVGTILVVVPGLSTEEWYSVITKEGVKGFCMKKFVSVKQ